MTTRTALPARNVAVVALAIVMVLADHESDGATISNAVDAPVPARALAPKSEPEWGTCTHADGHPGRAVCHGHPRASGVDDGPCSCRTGGHSGQMAGVDERGEVVGGLGPGRTKETSAASCHVRCANITGCAMWSWSEDDQWCKLGDWEHHPIAYDPKANFQPQRILSGPADCRLCKNRAMPGFIKAALGPKMSAAEDAAYVASAEAFMRDTLAGNALDSANTESPSTIDLERCAAASPAFGPGRRAAVVLAHDLGTKDIHGLRVPLVRAVKQMGPLGIDVVLIVPAAGSPMFKSRDDRGVWPRDQGRRALHETELRMLRETGVVLKYVPWSTPPGLTRNAHPCAKSQLLKFHVYNLTEYAAVGFTDGDVAIVNTEEFVKLLRCASDHKTLYAPGKIGSPINYGMFVTMPSQAAFDAAVWFAQAATYTRHGIGEHRGGWDFAGAWPIKAGHPFAGYGCDQGMAWVFFCGSGLALASDTYKVSFPFLECSPWLNLSARKSHPT